MVPLSDIKLNPKNRNKHPKDQIDELVHIIKSTGFRRPVTISNLSGFLSCGEGRYLAAKKMGLKEIPAMYQDYDSEDQEYADGIADNAIDKWAELDLSSINNDVMDLGPDFDIRTMGIKDFVIEPAEKYDESTEDEVPEHVEPKAKLGDIYQMGAHRLMCGSSTEIDKVEMLMNGEKVDMVYTDPPYGINEKGDRSNRGGLTQGNNLKDFQDDSIQYAIDAFNICQGFGIEFQVWWGANYYCHSLPQQNNWLVWDKRLEEKQTDFNSDAELAWIKNGKSSIRIFRHLWKGLIKGSEHGSKRVHPTQKPIALAEWCFEKYGDPKSVLDLFGGSGSTLIACEKTNRKCFMMELDPHYIDVIIARWEKYTGKKAELING